MCDSSTCLAVFVASSICQSSLLLVVSVYLQRKTFCILSLGSLLHSHELASKFQMDCCKFCFKVNSCTNFVLDWVCTLLPQQFTCHNLVIVVNSFHYHNWHSNSSHIACSTLLHCWYPYQYSFATWVPMLFDLWQSWHLFGNIISLIKCFLDVVDNKLGDSFIIRFFGK